MTKKDLNSQLDTIEELLRIGSIKENRHEEFYNGVVHAIVTVKEMIKLSDLEEGE